MNSFTRSENGLPAHGCRRTEKDEKKMKNRYEIKKRRTSTACAGTPLIPDSILPEKKEKGKSLTAGDGALYA